MDHKIILWLVAIVVACAWTFFIVWLIRNVREENKKERELAADGRQYWKEIADQFYKEQEEDKNA